MALKGDEIFLKKTLLDKATIQLMIVVFPAVFHLREKQVAGEPRFIKR